MDYRKLLIDYMQLLLAQEGHTFVDTLDYSSVTFTEEEKKEIRDIEEEARSAWSKYNGGK